MQSFKHSLSWEKLKTSISKTNTDEQAEIAQYTPEERREYEASVKDYWDYYSTMKTAEDKAEKRGENKKAIEVARKMKAKGFSAEDIADVTGLSIDEIEKL